MAPKTPGNDQHSRLMARRALKAQRVALAEQAWARMRIHLNLGDVEAALVAGLAAIEKSFIDRRGHHVEDMLVCSNLGMPRNWLLFSPDDARFVVAPKVLAKHAMGPELRAEVERLKVCKYPLLVALDADGWAQAQYVRRREALERAMEEPDFFTIREEENPFRPGNGWED